MLNERTEKVTPDSILNDRGGWAIMSAMIAIFVSLIMVGGIFAIVQMTMQGSKVQAAQSNLSSIRMATRQLYTGQPDYSGLTNSIAQSAGLFPETMMTSSNSTANAWNGSVSLAENTSDSTMFDITYDGVPQEACIKLAKFGYGSWEAVDVDGTTVSQSGGGAVGDAVSGCSASSAITFTSD